MSLSNPLSRAGIAPPASSDSAAAGERSFLRDNSLSLVCFGFFVLFLIGQSFTGWMEFNEDAKTHGQAAVGLWAYFATGHFWEATLENWESEFLQMAAYVVLTSCLVQAGSAESKKPDEENAQDQDPAQERDNPEAPGPVKKGGLAMRLYSRSLSLTLTLFFLLSLAGHAFAGAKEYSNEQIEHGQQAVSMLEYMGTSRFWFESFQNWQSEFLAVFVLVVLSIWLRDRGSPESKPVAAPHSQTGSE